MKNKTEQKYHILLGRRQPAHIGHVHQLHDVVKNGGFPVIFIGSVNDVTNPFYNPLQNPLDLAESETQLKIILENEGILDYKIIPIKDFGDDEPWLNFIIESSRKSFPEAPINNFYFHFFAKNSKADETFKTLDKYVSMFQERGIEPAIFAGQEESSNLSSSHFRKLPIDNDEFLTLPAAGYLSGLAYEARKENNAAGFRGLINYLPITMLDLSLKRLIQDHKITPEYLEEINNGKRIVNVEELVLGLSEVIKRIQKNNKTMLSS